MLRKLAADRRNYLLAFGVFAVVLLGFGMRSHHVLAAACTAPTTDYGTVSGLSVTLPATATYRVWSRMAAPDTTNNSYLLEIDGSSCYTVGGSAVPTYASGASTYFNNDSTNWISKTSSGTQIDVSLTAGAHTLKLIGNAAGVVVDRVILTQDTACVPTGAGDNCANPPDTTPPVVSITSPANNANLSGVTTVTADATDDVAVNKVEFYVDGVLKATDTSAPYTYSLDPASLSIGSYRLVAKAYDAAGNSSSSTTVTVNVTDTTAPTVSLTAPTSGATLSGTTVLTATASDNVGVSKVEFYVDNGTTPVGTDTASPYSLSYDTTGLSNTSHSFTAKAYDAAGNVQTSTAVNATISNGSCGTDTTPPTVSLTTPAAGATISGSSYTVGATASDACGVTQVQFYVDNVLKSTDTSAPFSYTLDTTGLTNTSHNFKAVATDTASTPNTATSPVVSATVANYLPEDIDQNGHVDLLDFHLLVLKYGQTGSGLGRTDINGDGRVDLLDFHLLVTKFGT